jgi:Arc/MetJ-type ribon-helix-helix transcriptional regulator
MVRTQIQLTEHQVKGVKALARAEGISAAEVIRRAIDELIQSKPMLDHADKRARAMRVVGRFRSGRSDISRNHDSYLSEAYRK